MARHRWLNVARVRLAWKAWAIMATLTGSIVVVVVVAKRDEIGYVG
jgi:hypothetical protein